MAEEQIDWEEFFEFLLHITLVSVSVFYFYNVFTTIISSISFAIFVITVSNLYQIFHI